MPSVCRASREPINGCHLPARMARSHSGMRLASDRMCATASSATAADGASGVEKTPMPSDFAAARSTLSSPAPQRAMIFSDGAARSTTAVNGSTPATIPTTSPCSISVTSAAVNRRDFEFRTSSNPAASTAARSRKLARSNVDVVNSSFGIRRAFRRHCGRRRRAVARRTRGSCAASLATRYARPAARPAGRAAGHRASPPVRPRRGPFRTGASAG